MWYAIVFQIVVNEIMWHQLNKKIICDRFFLCSWCFFIIFFVTAFCSVQPDMPGKNAFWTAGTISLFLWRMWWCVLRGWNERFLQWSWTEQLISSFLCTSFLWMSFNILSSHADGTALVSRTLLNSFANVWSVHERWKIIPYGRPSGPGLELWLADLRTSKIYLGLIGSILKGTQLRFFGWVWMKGNHWSWFHSNLNNVDAFFSLLNSP